MSSYELFSTYRIFFSFFILDKIALAHTSTTSTIYHHRRRLLYAVVHFTKSDGRISTAGKSLTLWSCRFSQNIANFMWIIFHIISTEWDECVEKMAQQEWTNASHSKDTQKVCDRISISFRFKSTKVWRKTFQQKKWAKDTSSSSLSSPSTNRDAL